MMNCIITDFNKYFKNSNDSVNKRKEEDMSTLETRAYNNEKPIDTQWINENETKEVYYGNNKGENGDRNSNDWSEAKTILEGIKALQDGNLEELKTARDELEKIKETKENINDDFSSNYSFESEEEYEKEVRKLMG